MSKALLLCLVRASLFILIGVIKMRIHELIGKVAIRRAETSRGNALFYNEPCLLLACDSSKAIACALEDSELCVAGRNYNLGMDFFDDDWVEYGSLLNAACTVRAQMVRKILDIMGITADEDSILTLCRAVSYKKIYDELRGQLNLDSLIYALEPTYDIFDSSDSDASASTSASENQNTDAEGTAWNDFMPKRPKLRGFIRRG